LKVLWLGRCSLSCPEVDSGLKLPGFKDVLKLSILGAGLFALGCRTTPADTKVTQKFCRAESELTGAGTLTIGCALRNGIDHFEGATYSVRIISQPAWIPCVTESHAAKICGPFGIQPEPDVSFSIVVPEDGLNQTTSFQTVLSNRSAFAMEGRLTVIYH